MKLVGKTYCWGKGSHVDGRCWFVLKDFRIYMLRTFLMHLKQLQRASVIVVGARDRGEE